MLHQEPDTVLLRRDRIRLRDVDDLDAGDADLDPSGRTLVLLDGADHAQTGLLREFRRCLEVLLADVSLEHHGLDSAGAVPHLEEVQLALAAHVVEPTLDEDVLADVFLQVMDGDGGKSAESLFGHGVRSLGKHADDRVHIHIEDGAVLGLDLALVGHHLTLALHLNFELVFDVDVAEIRQDARILESELE